MRWVDTLRRRVDTKMDMARDGKVVENMAKEGIRDEVR